MDAQDATSVALSHHLAVGEARRVISAETVPVVDEGRLIGILRRRSLEDSQDSVMIAALMEPAVSVAADEPIETATDLESFLNGGPIPVIDDDHRLIGVLRP
jgi:Mg/Co/Ni transporter MgtE